MLISDPDMLTPVSTNVAAMCVPGAVVPQNPRRAGALCTRVASKVVRQLGDRSRKEDVGS